MVFGDTTNISQILFIFLCTVVMGYLLGLTVSGVVDYRLKDAVVNMPPPRITLSKKDIEGFQASPSVSSGAEKKKKPVNLITKQNIKSKKQIAKQSQKQTDAKATTVPTKDIKEHFTSSGGSTPSPSPSPTGVSTGSSSFSILQNCPELQTDPHRMMYESAYRMAERMTRRDGGAFPFQGSNAETLDSMYESIEDTPLHREAEPASLPRAKRCPQSKCQRPWQNCTTKPSIYHHPTTTVVNKV